MTQLSKIEDKIYEKLKREKMFVFKIADISKIFGFSRIKAYNSIKALKKKNIIKKAGNGFYAFSGADDFAVASSIVFPSYISFWTALNYHGFSGNAPKQIFLATTRFSKQLNSFKYIKISKQKFFGYISISDFAIADKEKTIVDCLAFPKYCGGIKEVINGLKDNINSINLNKIIQYSLKLNNKAVLRRLGYIFENFGLKSREIDLLNKHKGLGYELLDPALKKKNNLNKRWLLDINI